MEKIHVKTMLSWLINDDSSSSQAKITSTNCALRVGQSMFAIAFGRRPKSVSEEGYEPTCWGCGQKGHRRGDPSCKAEPGADERPKGKRKFVKPGAAKGGDGGPTAKKPTGICRWFAEMTPANLGLPAD